MPTEPPPTPSIPTPKIFLISFNKCGTGSFFRLFRGSGIAALHHHLPGGPEAKRDPGGSLALAMTRNFMLARDPLIGIDGYTAYTDLAWYDEATICEAGRLYPYFHRHYPDAYFILAVREVDDWVRSRLSHGGGSLAARAGAALGGMSHEQVAALWREQFAAHDAEACDYFAGRPDARFLRFDLDRDGSARIAAFLAPDFGIDLARWGRANVTADATRRRAAERRGEG